MKCGIWLENGLVAEVAVSHDPRGKIVPLLYFSKFCNLRARIILLIFQRQL